MWLVIAGGGFLFYCTSQYIKLDMESKFVQIEKKKLINQLKDRIERLLYDFPGDYSELENEELNINNKG